MTNKEILDWLAGQCVPGEGGCMIWRGGISTGGKGSALPTVRHPVTRRNMPGRRVLMLAMGKDVAGKCCTSSCRNPMCMAQSHAEAITRKELQARTGPKLAGNRVRNAKLAEAARRQSPLTIEKVREMRASGMRATEAASAYGVQLQVAARILRGDSWRDYTNDPFAGLGA